MLDAGGYEVEERRGAGPTTLAIRGRVDVYNARRVLQDLTSRLGEAGDVTLDLSGIDYFDSAGGAVVIQLRLWLAERGRGLRLGASTPAIDGFLGLLDQDALARPSAPRRDRSVNLFAEIGEATLEFVADTRDLLLFSGELILGLGAALRHPTRIRWRETWLYMERTGLDAIPIVALISFLMGLITAFQASIQLTQFGADIYVANLVGLSITRELGPLMTAIISAGRSGAAFAAEIGTMKVSEEVDALQTMGLDRTRFLVTPKVLALLAMQPCLTLFADLIGILGGLTVAVLGLELPAQVYLRQTRQAMVMWDITSGLLKSVAFAVMIAGVGCRRGFQASTGAESVGRITTSAIVAGIFLIIITDAVFTVIFHYW